MPRLLSRQDVIYLLRKEVKRAGGQVAWSKKMGINRPHLNLVMNGRRPLTESILAALNLDTVYRKRRDETGAGPGLDSGKAAS
jgi:hypothetical protein